MRVDFNDLKNKPDIGVYSSGSKSPVGVASGQFEFNVSYLRDPAGQKLFVGLNGTYPDVRDWVKEDRRVPVIVKDCLILADDIRKPKTRAGGQNGPMSTWLSFSFQDFHGKWVAPAVAELVANALSEAGYNVAVHHKGLPPEAQFSSNTLPK